jgi:transcriptional regulator with XRE-family HTH domain
MPAARLPNYLLSHRKRSGLSQGEVAYLLGTKSDAAICRHERFRQTPNLQSLLAYEILFRTPVRSLFGGVHDDVEHKLRKRIQLFIRALMQAKPDVRQQRKLEVLKAVLEDSVRLEQA